MSYCDTRSSAFADVSRVACVSTATCGLSRLISAGRAFDFQISHIRRRVNDLPLQVGERHHVVVDHAERPDARGRQIHQHRRAEPARPDRQHARALQRGLARPADLAQHDMARVTLQFFRGQHRLLHRHSDPLEHFPAKWTPVRRRKCDQCRNPEHNPIPKERIVLWLRRSYHGVGHEARRRCSVLLAAASMASAEPAKQAEPKAKAKEQTKEQPKRPRRNKPRNNRRPSPPRKPRRVPRRRSLQGDPRFLQRHSARRAHRDPERPDLDRRLQRRRQRRIRRPLGCRRQGVPEAQWRQGNRRAQPAGARGACRRRQAEAGRRRLAHRRRPFDRRTRRHSRQADAEHRRERRHQPLGLAAQRDLGRDIPHRADRHDARRRSSSA